MGRKKKSWTFKGKKVAELTPLMQDRVKFLLGLPDMTVREAAIRLKKRENNLSHETAVRTISRMRRAGLLEGKLTRPGGKAHGKSTKGAAIIKNALIKKYKKFKEILEKQGVDIQKISSRGLFATLDISPKEYEMFLGDKRVAGKYKILIGGEVRKLARKAFQDLKVGRKESKLRKSYLKLLKEGREEGRLREQRHYRDKKKKIKIILTPRQISDCLKKIEEIPKLGHSQVAFPTPEGPKMRVMKADSISSIIYHVFRKNNFQRFSSKETAIQKIIEEGKKRNMIIISESTEKAEEEAQKLKEKMRTQGKRWIKILDHNILKEAINKKFRNVILTPEARLEVRSGRKTTTKKTRSTIRKQTITQVEKAQKINLLKEELKIVKALPKSKKKDQITDMIRNEISEANSRKLNQGLSKKEKLKMDAMNNLRKMAGTTI